MMVKWFSAAENTWRYFMHQFVVVSDTAVATV